MAMTITFKTAQAILKIEQMELEDGFLKWVEGDNTYHLFKESGWEGAHLWAEDIHNFLEDKKFFWKDGRWTYLSTIPFTNERREDGRTK